MLSAYSVRPLVLAFLVVLAVLAVPSRAQMSINYYVDPAGSDSNPGTWAQPFQHIQYAVSQAAAMNAVGHIVTVNINPGHYRENVAFPSQIYTNNMITLQASNLTNLPILDGADIWSTNWIYVSGGIYSHPYTPGPSADCTEYTCSPSDLEPEQVWYNGVLLQQAQSSTFTAAGQFFVDRTGSQIYVLAPGGANPNSPLTEVVTRAAIFNAVNTGLMQLTINGLVIQRSADLAFTGAMVDIEGVNANLTLKNLTTQFSSNEGLFIMCAGGAGGVPPFTPCGGSGTGTFIMQNVHADNNGFIGMDPYETRNLNASNITTNNNTYKERLPGSTLRDSYEAGVKFGSIHSATIDGWTSNGNLSPAFWLDTDAKDVTISNLVASNNEGGASGLVFEAVQGPVVVNSAILCQNQTGVDAPSGNNITLGSTAGAFVIFANFPLLGSVQSIAVSDVGGVGDVVTDFETGTTQTVFGQNWNIKHIASWVQNGGRGGDFLWLNNQTTAHASKFWSSLVADHNVYWDPQVTTVFNYDITNTSQSDYGVYLTWVPNGEAHSVYAAPFSNDPTTQCVFQGNPGIWPR